MNRSYKSRTEIANVMTPLSEISDWKYTDINSIIGKPLSDLEIEFSSSAHYHKYGLADRDGNPYVTAEPLDWTASIQSQVILDH